MLIYVMVIIAAYSLCCKSKPFYAPSWLSQDDNFVIFTPQLSSDKNVVIFTP